MAPTEKRVDWDFVLPCFKTWEMALVEALTWVVPVAEAGLYWYLVRKQALPPSLPPSLPPCLLQNLGNGASRSPDMGRAFAEAGLYWYLLS